MSKLIGIVGPSGTGKTSSIRNLDPKKTYLINPLNKDLPWRGSRGSFNADAKNYAEVDDYNKIYGILQGVSEKRPDIKYVVIDDSSFLMSIELFSRAKESGYAKFTDIAHNMFKLVQYAKQLRDDLYVIFIFHEDLVTIEGQKIANTRKIKTAGKMIDEKYELPGLFMPLLWTHVEFEKDIPKYKFITNRTEDYPAKSPFGCFENLYIDNDLNEVISTLDSYYS